MRWPLHSGAGGIGGVMLPAPAVAALWQAPLIGLLSFEIGWVLPVFWAAGLGVALMTRLWQRWYVQLPLIALLVSSAALAMPVKSADFFIALLVGVLPLTWQLEDAGDDRVLSPAGLTPTIFLVGSVFLFQIQFAVLLLVVIWLLAFLLWYCMALTGFRLDALSLRWAPVLLLSAGVAALIVLLFIAVPRISTGFIPGFAAHQKVALTDHIAPGGMRDLLRDETIAFRAVPQQEGRPVPRYWRVFVLDSEGDGEWRRGASSPAPASVVTAPAAHSYLLLLDDHNPATLPSPDWPGGFSRDYAYSRSGELITTPRANPRRIIVGGARQPPDGLAEVAIAGLSPANPRLTAWARKTRQGMASDRDFAMLIMQRFAANYRYDTTLDLPQKDALDSFFFDRQSGYCAYFATAMATALRAAGIEANIIMGYLGGTWNGYGGFWTVRNADAHAWVEARLDGGGWQRFDPTLGVMNGGAAPSAAGATRPALRTGNDANGDTLFARLQMAGQWVEALNTRITIAVMNYGQDEDSADAAGRDNAALVFLALGLAMTGVIAASALLAFRRLGARRSHLERRLERLLAAGEADPAREDGETLINYASRRARDLPPAQASRATALAARITAFRFAPGGAITVHDIGAELRALKRQMRAGRHLRAGRTAAT